MIALGHRAKNFNFHNVEERLARHSVLDTNEMDCTTSGTDKYDKTQAETSGGNCSIGDIGIVILLPARSRSIFLSQTHSLCLAHSCATRETRDFSVLS